MTREDVIKKCKYKINILYKTCDFLISLPLNEPVVITIQLHDNWSTFDTSCACIPVQLNTSSIKCKVIAIERRGYPYAVDGMFTPRLSSIKGWRYLESKELPLMIGWEEIYPLLEQLIKSPERMV